MPESGNVPFSKVNKPLRDPHPRWGGVRILTWGGIRGGISVALALSMPVGPERNFILPVAYCVVVFSIVVQGLSLGWLVKKVEKEKVSNP